MNSKWPASDLNIFQQHTPSTKCNDVAISAEKKKEKGKKKTSDDRHVTLEREINIDNRNEARFALDIAFSYRIKVLSIEMKKTHI